jgi:hypothetical protein
MALVWEKVVRRKHYKVTRAGASTRLYTNGVFHSQYNPNEPISGNLWDLLFVPAFMHLQPEGLRRVLVLGVGGGAVIQQLNSFLKPKTIVAVDLDGIHLQVARRFFGVNADNVTLVQAEARQWLEQEAQGAFDLIIEDLFMDDVFVDNRGAQASADPVRAIEADESWFNTLLSKLSPDGVLAMNFESGRCLSKSAYRQFLRPGGNFKGAYKLSSLRYENTIGVFLRQAVSKQGFIENLQRFQALDQRRKTCRLQFICRKL